MKKALESVQRVVSSIVIGSMFSLYQSASAATPPPITPVELPGSVLPERAGNIAAPAAPTNPRALPPITRGKQLPASLGPAAEKIKFKLNKVFLQNNHVYTEAELAPLYQKKIGTMISVAELQGIVQDITNYYRNNGYILTRAVLPPQHVANGIVYIQIIEGYIDQVKVVGNPKGARKLIAGYGEHISAIRPTQLKVMEKYLLMANEIPGVQVKAVLEPSKGNVGASNLDMVATIKTFSGFLSYDNYGTRFIGPNQVSGGGEMDSIFISGDSTNTNFARTTYGQELNFFQVSYNMPVGTKGMRLLFSANRALTQPGMNLAALKIMGEADTFMTTLQYPLIRSRTQNLTADTSFNYTDSYVTTLQPSVALYTDHLRTWRAGVNYNLADSLAGNNSAAVHFETGVPGLGGTTVGAGNAVPQIASRYGASNHFLKIDSQLSRIQQFGATRYSAFFQIQGQYAFDPLLATEQFGFGGASQGLGRGYDPAEIIGDKGVAYSVELRANISPELYLLQAAQLYVFYDSGVIWNLKNIADQNSKSSATSTGLGSRFFFARNLSGNLMIAQPLTKQVAALQPIGDGRQPRVYFSVTASD